MYHKLNEQANDINTRWVSWLVILCVLAVLRAIKKKRLDASEMVSHLVVFARYKYFKVNFQTTFFSVIIIITSIIYKMIFSNSRHFPKRPSTDVWRCYLPNAVVYKKYFICMLKRISINVCSMNLVTYGVLF